MNRTINAIKDGEQVATEALFDIVNSVEITSLMLRTAENKNTFMAMQINKCEEINEEYVFSQSCTSCNSSLYTVKKTDIDNVTAKYYSDSDALYITCELKNGLEMLLLVVNASNMKSRLSDFREMDVYELQEFLEDALHGENEYYCASTRITDIFGFNAKLNPKRVYVNTLDEDWKLHISDDFNSFEVPITDDSINEFYIRDKETAKEIIVKPYGQSFMEISLLFFKKRN